MITLDLAHLFNTDPKSTKVPKIVFDWVMEREAEYSKDIEFKITFWRYKSTYEEGYPECDKQVPKEKALLYERIYGPSIPCFVYVKFPLTEGFWSVRLIGEDRKAAHKAAGLLALLDASDPRIEVILPETTTKTLRGYIRTQPLTLAEEELVDIKCDRNINDEWKWRGTGQQFIDEKIKPLVN